MIVLLVRRSRSTRRRPSDDEDGSGSAGGTRRPEGALSNDQYSTTPASERGAGLPSASMVYEDDRNNVYEGDGGGVMPPATSSAGYVEIAPSQGPQITAEADGLRTARQGAIYEDDIGPAAVASSTCAVGRTL